MAGESGGGFKRVLGKWDIFTLSFGAMIGWGWVVLTSDWILKAGVTGAILAFLIGGLVVALVGLTYSELTAAMPKVGGAHVLKFLGITAFLSSLGLVYLYLPGNSSALNMIEWTIVGCWLILGIAFYGGTSSVYGQQNMRSKMNHHLSEE